MLVTVWSGAIETAAAKACQRLPLFVAYGPAIRHSQAGAAMQRYSGREMVYACLSHGGWHSTNGLIARTGLSDRRVRFVLRSGVEDGTLERMDGAPVRQGLRPVFLYRRKQTAEAAA